MTSHPFLHDVELRPDGYLLQGDRHLHFPWQVRIVKLVRVANAFGRHQLQILATEGVAVTGGEIGERHLVGAADPGIHVVNLAGKSVGGEPFGHGVGIEERPIDSLRRRAEHAVKSDGIGWHDFVSFRWAVLLRRPTLLKLTGGWRSQPSGSSVGSAASPLGLLVF